MRRRALAGVARASAPGRAGALRLVAAKLQKAFSTGAADHGTTVRMTLANR